ncbi:hypothetical protein ABZS86_34395 [Streptomyces sp. NPDC005355]|uniref:Rv1733c family protein n=1 Tax=Streptomyces sp. NPDC005355 TaxID=3157038 RepID=UPI0033BF239C
MNTHGPRRAPGLHPPRLLGPARGPNPLRRPSDRAQSWFTTLFVLLLVFGLPAASVSAGYAAYAAELRVVHAESAERHQITARLAEDAPGGPHRADAQEPRQARVHWTGEEGTRHTGTAMVSGGTRAGDPVRVWVDREGALAPAPTPVSTARTMGWFTGCMTAGAMATLLIAARARVRQVLDRRRFAQWEAEWKVVEPAWSGRNRR